MSSAGALPLPKLVVGSVPARDRRIRSSRLAVGLLVAGDLICSALALWAAGGAGFASPALVIGLLVLLPLVFHRLGLYRPGVTSSSHYQIDALGRSLLLIGAVLVMIRLLPAAQVVPNWATLVRLLAAIGSFALVMRLLILPPMVRRFEKAGRARVLIIGTDREAVRLAQVLETGPQPSAEIVGFAAGVGRLEIDPKRYVGELDEVGRLCADGEVDRILIVRPDLTREDLLRLAFWAVEGRVDVGIASESFAVVSDRIGSEVDWIVNDALNGTHLYVVRPTPLKGPLITGKRIVDVLGATLGIILLSPALLSIAAAIKLTSSGPVLFRQTRVGKDGREFTFLKFRSMVAGASSTSHKEFIKGWITGEPAGVDSQGRDVFKLVDDPRITRVGRFIRRTSLDELPQLFNVLAGDMSLVGPRPCLPYERECFKSWHRRRLTVTPGCTGLWQVTGRSKVQFDDMVLLDIYYMSTWSLLGDIRLMLRTLPVMLLARGGH